jgi:hypothetical protein
MAVEPAALGAMTAANAIEVGEDLIAYGSAKAATRVFRIRH